MKMIIDWHSDKEAQKPKNVIYINEYFYSLFKAFSMQKVQQECYIK